MKRALLLPIILFLFSAQAYAQERPTHIRTIEVVGDGEINVVPNEVVINVGVETTDRSLEKAKAENDKRIQQTIKTLRDAGIEERLIQTATINIEPQYDYRQTGRVFLGFLVRRNITATIKQIDKLDDVTSRIVNAGITSIYNYEYRTSDEKKLMADARSKAIASAKEKAESMAKDVGLTIVKAYSVIEDQPGRPIYPMYRRGTETTSSVPMDASVFSLGEIIVRSSVRVIFEAQ